VTWTYSGDPSNSALDEVRFLVGDVDEHRQQIADEEINYVLSVHADTGGSNYIAAAVVAEAIAARYSQKANKSVGGLSISYGEQRNSYLELAKRLRSAGRTMVGPPQLGGGGQTYLGNEFL
jgi:hypothetical protein